MLSSDKNVETIARLVDVLKHYIGLQGEYIKLDATEKTVRLLTAAGVFVVVSLVLGLIVVLLAMAGAMALAPLVGLPLAFVIVAAVLLVALLIVVSFRQMWIERPLVRLFSNILIEK